MAMIDKAAVTQCLKEIGGYDDGFEEKYSSTIDYACETISRQANDDADLTDVRLVFLAAAQANYIINCSVSDSAGVTSFTAGDVSFTQSGETGSNAKEILETAKQNAESLISRSGFAFIGV